VAYTAADKLGAGVGPGGPRRVAVQTLSGADGAAARSRAAGLGRRLRAASQVGAFRTQFLELDGAEAAALAEDPAVVSIQPAPEPRLLDERADQIVAGTLVAGPADDPSSLVPGGPGYLAFHEALGLGTATFPFVVDVTDEGIDIGSTTTDLADLHEGGDAAQATRIAYADNVTDDPDARDCGGHGTINASIIGGFNNGGGEEVEDAGFFNYGLGVAPRVRVGATKLFRCDNFFDSGPNSLTDLADNSYAKGARIANHSWGADTGGAYTADSREYDAIVRDAQPGTPGNQELVEVFAAGNAGFGGVPNTVGSPATAKNVISVGASENVRETGTNDCSPDSEADDARDIAGFSSRGPTDDLRTKPDLVAPGTNVTGSQSHAEGYDTDADGVCVPEFPAGNLDYTISSGTSHSSPVVAGMAALFREWFRQKKGGGTAVPSPALTRAALANAATDIAGGTGVGGSPPNGNQGWGLGNLPRLLDAGPRFFFDQQAIFGASGDSFARSFSVSDSSRPVRVTLAWTDPPGPTTGNSFVNNLDLTVTSTSGTFKGNFFAGGVSVAGGTADPRNNLESVYLPGGSSGDFTVTVTAANVAGDGVPGIGDGTDQDFALVVSNAGALAPGAPAGLVATPRIGAIALDWADVPGSTGYEVFRREAGGTYPSTPTASSTASELVDSGVTAGRQYCYVVRAVNESAAGPASGEACATVPAVSGPAPVTLDLSSVPRSVRVSRRGTFTLRFAGTPGKAGTIRLRTVKAVSAARRRRLVVARRSFTMPASGRARVKMKLTRKSFRVLRRVRRLPVSTRVTLAQTRASKRVTLRAPRPRPRG
jgi:subtilisin family serine protease